MTWMNAWLRGLAFFVYIVIATVWLPDFVVKLDSVAGAAAFVRDLIVLGVWGAAFIGGLWLLRFGQRRGLV
jgi:predicted tellurium resistance membrane protein TerC